jgi:hypothetical protein
MKRLATLTLITVIGMPLLGYSQSFNLLRQDRNFLVSIGSGTANYYGEMVNPGEFGKLKPNIALGAEYYLNSRISARAELTWFQLSGDDAKANDSRKQRNLSFTANCIEFSALGAFNLSPMGLRFYQRSTLNLHVFAGIGVLYFNPKATYQGHSYALAPLQTEGVKYSRVQPVIPLGLGGRIKLNPFFNILVEAGYRITFTDYLDDVSARKYPNPATLKSDLSRALSDRRGEIGVVPANDTDGIRGNPDKKDGYFITNITLQYYLPVTLFENSDRKLYNRKRKAYYRRPRSR